MNIKEFEIYQEIFLENISKNDLLSDMHVVDSESVLSRVYKKLNGLVPNKEMSYLIVYNTHLINNEMESAFKFKKQITDV